MRTSLLTIICGTAVAAAACVPNTYYSATDPYVIGLRWYDRGVEGEAGRLPGLTKSPSEFYEIAVRYWEPLLAKDDCDAEYMMGTVYFLRRGKPQDNTKALALWRKAADGNQQRGQWALGDLYYQGVSAFHRCASCGLERDLVMALTWYKLFEKSAKYDGEKKYLSFIIPKITAEMTPEQIKAAEERAQSWKPVPKDCGARNLW
jgi:hypothetical protein